MLWTVATEDAPIDDVEEEKSDQDFQGYGMGDEEDQRHEHVRDSSHHSLDSANANSDDAMLPNGDADASDAAETAPDTGDDTGDDATDAND